MAKKVLTQSTVVTNNIQLQPDQVVGQAEPLKKSFDQGGIDNKSFVNVTHLPELQTSEAGNSGANAIGITAIGITGDNVSDAIINLKQQLDSAVISGIVPDNSIDTNKIIDGAVTLAKLSTSVAEKLVLTNLIGPNSRDISNILAIMGLDTFYSNKYWNIPSLSPSKSGNLTLDLSSSLLTSEATLGTKVVGTDTTNYSAGKEITISNTAGSNLERHIIDTIDNVGQLTLKTNLVNTYDINDPVYRTAPNKVTILTDNLELRAERIAANTPTSVRYVNGMSAISKVKFLVRDIVTLNTSSVGANSCRVGISNTTDANYIAKVSFACEIGDTFAINIGNGNVTRSAIKDYAVEITDTKIELFENEVSLESFAHSIDITTATNLKFDGSTATSLSNGVAWIEANINGVIVDDVFFSLSGVAGVNNTVSYANFTGQEPTQVSSEFLEWDNRKTLTEENTLAVIEWLKHNKTATSILESVSIVADGLEEDYELADKTIYNDDGLNEELQFFVDKETEGKNIAIRTTIQRTLATDIVIIERELGGLVK